MFKSFLPLAMVILAIGLLAPAPADAGLILDGQTVTYQYFFPDLSSPYGNADNGDKLVGPGVEVSNVADNVATMDISDTNLYVDYTVSTSWNPAVFNGFRITDTFGTIPDFTAVLINPVTNLVGFDSSRISFDADNIWVNWQGLAFNPNTVVSLDLQAAPEPGTLALMALGLFGVGTLRSKKK